MSLSFYQQNIVNPYPEIIVGDGFDYDFFNPRNEWVIAGIHDSYVNYASYPNVGTELRILGPLEQNNSIITVKDLKAYLALYPQNGKFNEEEQVIESISKNKSIENLRRVAQKIGQNKAGNLYTSVTTPEAQKPENQDNLGNPEDASSILPRMIAIPYDFSPEKIKNIRISFGLPIQSVLEPEIISEEEISSDPVELSDDSLDMRDWLNNVPPGDFFPKIYYNFTDNFYYYAIRTNVVAPTAFDIENENSLTNIQNMIRQGVTGILQFAGKYNIDNLQTALEDPNDDIEFFSHIEQRPNSRWACLIKIPRIMIDQLDIINNPESLKDEQLSPYKKSLILLDGLQNPVNKHGVYTLQYILENIPSLVTVLKYYENILDSQQLSNGRLDGLNIPGEIDRINSFPSNMEEFVTLNKINIVDANNDSFDLAFDDNMKINYVVYNGMLYNKFLGQTIFNKPKENEENPNFLRMNLSSMNAFSNQTTKSLGYIFYLRDIIGETFSQATKDWPSWTVFLTNYTIPAPRIDPTVVDNLAEELTVGGTEPPKLFETITEILRDSPSTSPDLFEKKILKQDAYNTLKKAAGNCDTTLGNAVKDIMIMYDLVNGKSSWEALQRKIIQDLKSELIKNNFELFPYDSALRQELGLEGDPESLERYLRNPGIIAKKIEDKINKEISCLLGFDDLSKELSLQLKPGDLPPDVNRLIKSAASPPIRIELTKTPFRRNKWEPFFKALEKLAIRVIKQLIMGAMVQFLEALLGCGPEETKRKADEIAQRANLYGFIDINNYIQGIDIVDVATKIGLRNKKITIERGTLTNLPDKVKIEESPPLLDQLIQFNKDVSQILTPSEFQTLLNSEASRNLLDTISEMVNNGEINIPQLREQYPEIQLNTYGEPVPNRLYGTTLVDILNVRGIGTEEQELIISLFQESLYRSDIKYAILGFTPESIRDYFKEIGVLLKSNNLALPEDPSPDEAFCPDPDPGVPFGELSDGQIRSQISQQIQNTKGRLDDICKVDPYDLSWINALNEWWADIGFPEQLKELLRYIAEISQAAQDWASEWFSSTDLMSRAAPRRLNRNECSEFSQSVIWNDIQDSDTYLREMKTGLNYAQKDNSTVYVSPQNYDPIEFNLNFDESRVKITVGRFGIPVELLGETIEEIPALPAPVLIETAYNIARELQILVPGGNRGDVQGVLAPAIAQWVSVLNVFLNVEYDRDVNTLQTYMDDLKLFLETAGWRFSPPPDGPFIPCLPFSAPVEVEGQVREGNAQPLPSLAEGDDLTFETRPGVLTPRIVIDWFTTPGVEMRVGPERTRRVFSLPEGVSVCSILTDIYLHHQGTINRQISQQKFEDVQTGDILSDIFIPPTENFQYRIFPERDDRIGASMPTITLRNVRNIDGEPSEELVNLSAKQEQSMARARGFGDIGNPFPLPDGETAAYYIPSLNSTLTQEILDQFVSENVWNRLRVGGATPFQERLRSDIVSVSNLSEDVYEQLCAIYYKTDRREEFKKVMKILFSDPFNETSEKCTDVELGRTLMRSLQNYLTPFMLNIIPLLRSYRAFNTPGTMAILSDYLARNVIKETTKSQTNKLYADNINILFSLYSLALSDDAQVFQGGTQSRWNWQWGAGASHVRLEDTPGRYQPVLDDVTYESKLKFIIQQYLVSMFEKISTIEDDAAFNSLENNFYDPNGNDIMNVNPLVPRLGNFQTPIQAYDNLLLKLFKSLRRDATEHQLRFLNRLISYKENRRDGPWSQLPNAIPISNREIPDFYAVGAYYLPAPFLLALYMISFDIIVDTSQRYSQYQIGLENTTKEANNLLIQMLNPAFVPTPLVIKFPRI
tara:strand:+ start:16855 stop:22335 length:5481 start_codon:yes stop_codon:yes gene_type:complete